MSFGTMAVKRTLVGAMFAGLCLTLQQCSDSAGPEPAGSIAIAGGNNQQSLKGTELASALAVVVKTINGAAAQDRTVVFSVIQGGGSLSSTKVPVNDEGVAATRLTLGPDVGPNRVRAVIEDDDSKSVTFVATSSNFFCDEAEDTLKICGNGCAESYGKRSDLFLLTPKSALFTSLAVGVVEVDPAAQVAAAANSIPPDQGVFPAVVWDCAFSIRGDFFVAISQPTPVVQKISTDGSISHFATLDKASEITSNSHGLLAGCDEDGPFVIGCRDTLLRFSEATFAGGINDDAVAVDPRRQSEDALGEDIYFIDKTALELKRLPLDDLTVEASGLQTVTALTSDEANGARGMICHGDGRVFIIVDTDDTKSLVEVTPGGSKTTAVDFFAELGPGTLAGLQSDLAFDSATNRLFTLDTLNNKLLAYDVTGGTLFSPLFSDSTQQAGISLFGDDSERVGLDALK